MFDSVRSRLTLWYVGVLALVLVAFSVTVYFLLAAFLYDRLDEHGPAELSADGAGARASRAPAPLRQRRTPLRGDASVRPR